LVYKHTHSYAHSHALSLTHTHTCSHSYTLSWTLSLTNAHFQAEEEEEARAMVEKETDLCKELAGKLAERSVLKKIHSHCNSCLYTFIHMIRLLICFCEKKKDTCWWPMSYIYACRCWELVERIDMIMQIHIYVCVCIYMYVYEYICV